MEFKRAEVVREWEEGTIAKAMIRKFRDGGRWWKDERRMKVGGEGDKIGELFAREVSGANRVIYVAAV